MEWARSKWTFSGEDDSELYFESGALIRVLEKPHSDWWRGELDGKEGLFPAAYVESEEPDEKLGNSAMPGSCSTPPGAPVSGATNSSPSTALQTAVCSTALQSGTWGDFNAIATLEAFDTLIAKGFVVESATNKSQRSKQALSKGDTVELHVIGYVWSESAKQTFASTRSPENMMTTKLDGSSLTQGLFEGLLGLQVGSRAFVTCKPHMAYGKIGIPDKVPPNSYIIYDVEVIATNQTSLVRSSGPPELLHTSENSTPRHGLALIAEEGLGLEDEEIAQAAESLALSVS